MMDSIPINEREIHLKFKPDYMFPESSISSHFASHHRDSFTDTMYIRSCAEFPRLICKINFFYGRCVRRHKNQFLFTLKEYLINPF